MTERAKHTPGPWRVYHALLRPQFPGNRIIEVQDADHAAIVAWSGFDNSDRLKKTHLANARLIAAAPDMLKALRLIEQSYPSNKHIALVRAAIAKAEGRQ